MMSMTFHESYGSLPTTLLRLYRKHNVSPADHDQILMAFGKSWNDTDIPWEAVTEFVKSQIRPDGVLRLPYYM